MAPSLSNLSCWVISDGRVGIEIQAAGLARAIGLAPEIKRLKARSPWGLVPPRLWRDPLQHLDPEGDSLAPPWPDVLVGCGRLAVAPSTAVRRAAAGGTFTIQIQAPKVPLDRFDLVVVPRHDRVTGSNVITTLGSMHGFHAEDLAEAAERLPPAYAALPQPRVAVMLGGRSRVHKITVDDARRLAGHLVAWSREQGASLMVTASRRTERSTLALLRQELAGYPAVFWTGEGENPYQGLLGLADRFVVTADSVNLVTEAACTGKPISVAPVKGGTRKFSRFHAAMVEAGITRPLSDAMADWIYEPLHETERVAAEIRQRLEARFPQEAQKAAPPAPSSNVDLSRRAG